MIDDEVLGVWRRPATMTVIQAYLERTFKPS
jgi:hypothetical protein